MGEGATYCEWCHPWAGGLGFYKKSWAKLDEQASKQHSAIESSSAPASMSVPWLISSPDFPWWSTVMWKYKAYKPLLPSFLLGMAFYWSYSNPKEFTFIFQKNLIHKFNLNRVTLPSIFSSLPSLPSRHPLLKDSHKHSPPRFILKLIASFFFHQFLLFLWLLLYIRICTNICECNMLVIFYCLCDYDFKTDDWELDKQ